MPDFGDDALRGAFMSFRRSLQTQIQQPGPQAARRTVRRRARTRTVLFAGALTAAVIGGVVTVPSIWGQNPVVPATPDPTVPGLSALVDEAFRHLGQEPGPASALQISWSGQTLESPTSRVIGESYGPFPAGQYTLRYACAGGGSIAFDWQTTQNGVAVNASEGSTTLDCSAERPRKNSEPIVLASPGAIVVTVRGDRAAAEGAGFAVMVTDPRFWVAQALMGDFGVAAPFSGAGTTRSLPGDPAVRTEVSEFDGPGQAELRVVCAGAGTLRVRFELSWQSGTTSAEDDLICTEAGAQLDLVRSAPAPAQLTVTFEELNGWNGQASYAFAVSYPQ